MASRVPRTGQPISARPMDCDESRRLARPFLTIERVTPKQEDRVVADSQSQRVPGGVVHGCPPTYAGR